MLANWLRRSSASASIRLGDIDSDDASGRPDGACDFDGRGAAPATDINHRGSASRRGKFEQRPGNRSERAVETILIGGPVFAVDSIPARALFFVESLCWCHGDVIPACATVLFGCELLHDLQRFFHMLIGRKFVGGRR